MIAFACAHCRKDLQAGEDLLGQIRRDSLPPLGPGYSGYRLGSRPAITVTEGRIKMRARELQKTWQKIIHDFPNTHWALIAQREQCTALGLEWRPSRE